MSMSRRTKVAPSAPTRRRGALRTTTCNSARVPAACRRLSISASSSVPMPHLHPRSNGTAGAIPIDDSACRTLLWRKAHKTSEERSPVDVRVLAVDRGRHPACLFESERLVQPTRRVGGEHEIELQGVESMASGFRHRVLDHGPADPLTAPRGADDVPGIGDVSRAAEEVRLEAVGADQCPLDADSHHCGQVRAPRRLEVGLGQRRCLGEALVALDDRGEQLEQGGALRGTEVAELHFEVIGHADQTIGHSRSVRSRRPKLARAQAPRRTSVSLAWWTIRPTNSATVGSSSIVPTTWPVGKTPASVRPSTSAARVIIGALAAMTTWAHESSFPSFM